MPPSESALRLPVVSQFEAEVCVVVVNYRTPEMVVDCLETVVPQVRALAGRVVVVDNASSDHSVGHIEDWISKTGCNALVELVASPVNGGFAAGNNLGIQSCAARHYLLLNSDTLVGEGALERLVSRMRNDERIGLLSPRLQWPDGTPQESCFRYHRPLSELIGSAGTGVLTRVLSRYQVAIEVQQTPSEPEWTSFACVLIRREVFETVGLLDEGFFMYFEDVELSHRARQGGWKIVHDPEAQVIHLRGGSSPLKAQARMRKRLPRYFHESRARYFYKVYGRAGLLLANLCWTLGWVISSVRSLLRRSYVAPTCKAQWRDIWIHFSDPMAPYTHPQ